MKTVRFHILLLLLATGLCIACQQQPESLPFYNTPDFEPVWKPSPSVELHNIPAFSLTNQNGKTVTDKSLDGNITIVNFIFTTCGGICPDMTKNLRTVLDTFAHDADIRFQSYSVKPWEDSVSRLREFAAIYGIEETKWDLLTGDKAAIYTLARQGYFAEEDAGFNKDSTEFLHTENVVLIDRNRHIRGLYKGTLRLDMQHLISDIELIRKEQ